MEYRSRHPLQAGLFILFLLILPVTGACAGAVSGEVIPRLGMHTNTPLPDSIASPANTLSIPPWSVRTTQPGYEDTSILSMQPSDGAQGSVSAWVRGSSMQGGQGDLSSSLQYHQKVTASGVIEKFVFSASFVS
ncbi:MAG: hypothetical protein LUQ01_01705 [Methanolinea sp.]|nr:hypothetical protein [Methanolinea sp.]